jgi:hypothetical protein
LDCAPSAGAISIAPARRDHCFILPLLEQGKES